MKPFLILILSLSFTFTSFGQADSLGFTNKAEAKNQLINGLKEGKWFEYLDNEGILMDSTDKIVDTGYYRLTIYKSGKPIGMVRDYYKNAQLFIETPYTNNEINGVMKTYYPTGQVNYEATYIHNRPNGVAQEYYENGKLKCTHYYTNGAQLVKPTRYDENGNVIK